MSYVLNSYLRHEVQTCHLVEHVDIAVVIAFIKILVKVNNIDSSKYISNVRLEMAVSMRRGSSSSCFVC